MKTFIMKGINIKIGSNVSDNDLLFDQAKDDDTWFHIYSFPSAHMWINTKTLDKNTLYQIALQLKKNSKYKEINSIPIIYTTKTNLTKTSKPGTLFISGKSKIITV